MPNLRVVYDNAATRATVAASTTSGTLVAANLLTDIKSEVWRSTGKTLETITLTWTNAESIGMVALPFSNLTSTSTMRVRCYTNTGDASPVLDSGTLASSDGGNGTLGVNNFAYGGGACSVIWLNSVVSVRKVVIDLVDTNNTAGYIESARVVTGSYWEPTNNADFGVEVNSIDTSRNERSDSGDLRTDRGYMYKSMSLELNYMPATDRNTLWKILRSNGVYKPVFISLTPKSTDTGEEQIFQMYGKLAKSSSLKYQFFNQYGTSIEIEEV